MCRISMVLASLVAVLALPRIAPAELVTHYGLDETSGSVAADDSGNGNDGSVSDHIWGVSGATARTGNAVHIGQAGDLTGYAPGVSSNFTLMLWINPDYAGYNRIVNFGDVSGVLHFSHENGGWELVWNSEEPLVVEGGLHGGWQHLAFVVTGGSNMQIYYDGSPFWNGSVGDAVPVHEFHITRSPQHSEPLAADIDDVAVFDEALGQVTINEYMNNGISTNPRIQFYREASADFEFVSPAVINVTLRAAEEGQTYTVDYAVSGGTATGNGVDYMLEAGTLIFEPGQTNKAISISIADDGLDEEDETIIITLSNPTGVDVELGRIAQHTYTIVDPRPSVSFDAEESNGPEDVTPAVIAVSLSHPLPKTVTAQYAVTGGTATSGEDYVLSNGTLTFEASQTTQNINVSVVDDKVPENDETIEMSLSNSTNAKLGAVTHCTYTILDTSPSVAFDDPTSGGAEDASPADIPVSLSHPWSQTVTVDYAVVGGTATGGGVDYTLADGTLQFEPNQVTINISLVIADDANDEGPETISLALSNPVNCKLGDISQHTFTIYERGRALLRGAYYFRLNSGESWEDVAKVGPHADVMVCLGDLDDEFVFWRGSSYRPYWQTDFGKWYVSEEVQMQGGAGGLRPDEVNQYSQVFIVENTPARAVVRWRYARDLANYDFKWGDFVDEYYAVYPDGVCIRTIRVGSDDMQQWLDPNNITIQNLQLTPSGITSLPGSWLNPAQLSMPGPSAGSYHSEGFDNLKRCYVVKCRKNGTPSPLQFKLDTAGGRSIHNPAIMVKNWGDADVALTLDGRRFNDYYAGHVHHFMGQDLVLWLKKESTAPVDISISPVGGTMPANRVPVVAAGPYQSIEVIPGSGPYSVDLAGAVEDDGLPNDTLTVTWSKVSGPGNAYFTDVNDPRTNVLLSTEGAYKLRLSANDGELSAQDDVIIIVDEDPDENNERVPMFPAGPADAGPFGAYYAPLKYSPEWDELWRVGDHVDVVVQFDEFAHRFVFWRGTSYIPCWVTDPNRGGWYTNEFLERRGDQAGCHGCAEPMSDKQCRHSHVRIIESHNARVIVHWRYAPVDVYYCHPYVDQTGWGDWVDEYYIIYPDAVGVRKATIYTSAPDDWTEWQEAIVLNQPGTMPEDNLNLEAVSLANMDGQSHTYSWEDGSPSSMGDPPGANIETINLKGQTRPFQVVNHNSASISCYGGHAPGSHFNWWNHWPVAQEKSDGTVATSAHRPSHTSLSHLRWQHYAVDNGTIKSRTKIMLHGMSDKSAADIVPLARSWEMPPVLTLDSSDFTGGDYDKSQRAYIIQRNTPEATGLEFILQGSPDSPIVNPCFVIENWAGDDNACLAIDGQRVAPGPDFRRGIEKSDEGVSSLVIWIKKESTFPISITVTKVEVPCDFDEDCDVDMADLAAFVWRWLDSQPGCQSLQGDLNNDCKVNFEDFAIMARQW